MSGPCTIEFFTGLSRDVIPLTDGHQLSQSLGSGALIYTQIGRFRDSGIFAQILLTNRQSDGHTDTRTESNFIRVRLDGIEVDPS